MSTGHMTYPAAGSVVHFRLDFLSVGEKIAHSRVVQYERIWFGEYGAHPET